MKIIAFAETTEALLAGAKTCTRREWNDSHALTFHAGEEVQAWDRSPRTGRGKRVGTIRLTCAPYKEYANNAPDADYAAEGFEYMSAHGLTLFGGARPEEVWASWVNAEMSYALWVVRFELV